MNKKPRPRSRLFFIKLWDWGIAAGSQCEPPGRQTKANQGLCPCNPALAAEGSGARGGEATPHTRAEAWGHCAPSSRIRLRRSCGRGTHPQGGGAPAIQLDRASFKTYVIGPIQLLRERAALMLVWDEYRTDSHSPLHSAIIFDNLAPLIVQ